MQLEKEVVQRVIELARVVNSTNEEEAKSIAVERARKSDLTFTPQESRLFEYLRSLTEGEIAELQALMWIGRGDAEAEDWERLLTEALEQKNSKFADVAYLAQTTSLADYLDKGLAKLQRTL